MKCRQLQNKTYWLEWVFIPTTTSRNMVFSLFSKDWACSKVSELPAFQDNILQPLTSEKEDGVSAKQGEGTSLSLSLSSPLTMSCIGVLPSLSLNHPDYQAGSAAPREKKWPELCLKKGTTRGASLCILAEKWLKSQPEKDRKKEEITAQERWNEQITKICVNQIFKPSVRKG